MERRLTILDKVLVSLATTYANQHSWFVVDNGEIRTNSDTFPPAAAVVTILKHAFEPPIEKPQNDSPWNLGISMKSEPETDEIPSPSPSTRATRTDTRNTQSALLYDPPQ